jgi:very-short-patch-repair endonuclease
MPKQVAPRPKTALWDGLKPRLRAARHEPTLAERKLWSVVRNNKLGVKFRQQHPVDSFYVDFHCVEAGLAIELDGSIHDQQVEEDLERQLFIEANNIRVLRFTNDDVLTNLSKVINKIREALTNGSSQPLSRFWRGVSFPGRTG